MTTLQNALSPSLRPMTPQEFRGFRDLIHRETGIWLRDGKQAMLSARLARRMRHHGLEDYSAYLTHVQRVQDGGKELAELINCITTNKTSFFREKHHFDFLAQTLLPEAVAAAKPGSPRRLRIWSAACSTGEEAYTIAITVLDALAGGVRPAPLTPGRALPSSADGWEIDVIASDIDTTVLATAAQGVYPEEAIDTVPDGMQARYFLRGKGNMSGRVRVKKEVMDRVRFERLNLMDAKWPPRVDLDAIFFRNALIYFNQETQELFLRRMLRCLRPGGYLFLGHSEHVPWLHDAVLPLNQTIYQLRTGDTVLSASSPGARAAAAAVSRRSEGAP